MRHTSNSIMGFSNINGKFSFTHRMRILLAWVLIPTAVIAFLRFIYTTLINTSMPTIQLGNLIITVNQNWRFKFMITRIGIALIVSTAALFVRKPKAVIVSALALVWVIAEYVTWWISSLRIAANTEQGDFSKLQHIAFLHHASWWDIWVLTVAVLLLTFELKAILPLNKSHIPSLGQSAGDSKGKRMTF